jgi:hypothetical protein
MMKRRKMRWSDNEKCAQNFGFVIYENIQLSEGSGVEK